MKRFAKALFLPAITVLTSCVFAFFLVKHVTDRRAPQECSEDVERLKKTLKRHGNLDRLVHQEYLFTKNQKKNHSAFWKNNVKHLEAVCDNLRNLIFRKKNICRSLIKEYGLVKEQLMLMKEIGVVQPNYELAKENCEKLSKILQQLSKIKEQEQEAFLMWENIKQLRSEQFQIVNEIQEKELYTEITDPLDKEVEDGGEEEKQMVAWKK